MNTIALNKEVARAVLAALKSCTSAEWESSSGPVRECGFDADKVDAAIAALRAALATESAAPPAQPQADSAVMRQAPSTDEFVRDLLWGLHPECCGQPCVGAEYMGQQEMVCCGRPNVDGLNDAQIVASLRARFPAPPEPTP